MEKALILRGEMIMGEAMRVREHSKRKMIKKFDVELANRRLNGV